jgi:hypothetical protein
MGWDLRTIPKFVLPFTCGMVRRFCTKMRGGLSSPRLRELSGERANGFWGLPPSPHGRILSCYFLLPDETGDFVMSLMDATMLLKCLTDQGYRAIHAAPLGNEAGTCGFWTKTNKHVQLTDRDCRFLRLYVSISLASGVPFEARGIRLEGGGCVRPDRAVLNSCMNANLVALNESTGVFELTSDGLRHLGLVAE